MKSRPLGVTRAIPEFRIPEIRMKSRPLGVTRAIPEFRIPEIRMKSRPLGVTRAIPEFRIPEIRMKSRPLGVTRASSPVRNRIAFRRLDSWLSPRFFDSRQPRSQRRDRRWRECMPPWQGRFQYEVLDTDGIGRIECVVSG